MLHCPTVHGGAGRPSRLGAVALVVALLAAACSDGDVTSEGSKQRSVDVTTPTTTADSASDSTDAKAAGDDLPVLDDVAAETWAPQTRTDELAVEIGQEELTAQQAVDAFALLYPDMPGATPSDLPAGDGLDASYTWILIRSVRDRLAPDQQAVVDAAEAGDELGTIDADGSTIETDFAGTEIPGVGDPPPDATDGTVLTGTTETGATDPTATTDGTGTSKPGGFVARRAGKQTYARYVRLAAATKRDWLAHRSDLPPYSIKIKLSTKSISGGGMETGPVDGHAGQCETTVDPGFVAGNPSDALIKFFFAHEFFHCVQFQWNPAMDWTVAKWVFDGSADYAALDVYRNVYVPNARSLWQQWFSAPGRPLASRWYDAWPLFETQWEEGTDPIPGIQAMVVGVNSADPNADLPLAGMDGLLFRMKWASRAYRSSQYAADDWQLSWPGPNPGSGPRENRRNGGTRGIGTYDVASNGGYVHPTVLMQMGSDVGYIDVTLSAGPLTTQTAAGVIHIADGSTARLCFEQDGCKCPEDTDSGAQQMAGREMIFSFAASDKATTAHVEAHKWDDKAKKDKCEKKKRKHGSSNGDPHLVTMDRQPYDMMTLGEFVTVRDPAGDFEVQTRNETVASLGATGTSAVAVDTGEHRITFTVAGFELTNPPVVRVDGEPTTETDLVLDGVTIHDGDTNATLTWPDGSVVELMFNLGWFVSISPADERAAVLEGLLGAADGDFTNDLRMPDGTMVDPVYAAVPDSDFSKAWQVDQGSSLFDYEPGQSVDTFRLPYPGSPLTQILQGAVDQCTQALGERAASYEITSCAYDVSVTGNDAYIESYQTVVDERVAEEDGEVVVVADEPATPPPGSVAEPTQTGDAALTLSGTLVASYSDQAFDADVVTSLNGSVAAKSGTVVAFRAERCTADVTLFLNVTQRGSGESGTSFICDPNGLQLGLADEDDEAVPGEVYLYLPADGEYDVAIDTDGEEPSFVTVEVFVDPEPTIVDGADVVKAGYHATLHGVGDTVVITSPDAGASFAATGLDTACAQEAYGASPIGTDEVWALAGFCAHGDTVSLPGENVPLVLFSRTDGPTEVALVPQ